MLEYNVLFIILWWLCSDQFATEPNPESLIVFWSVCVVYLAIDQCLVMMGWIIADCRLIFRFYKMQTSKGVDKCMMVYESVEPSIMCLQMNIIRRKKNYLYNSGFWLKAKCFLKAINL